MAGPPSVPGQNRAALRPLTVVYACVVAFVLFDLVTSMTVISTLGVGIVALVGSAAALVALSRPLIGVGLSLLPLVAVPFYDESGFWAIPVAVCSTAVVVTQRAWVVATVLVGYAAIVMSIHPMGIAISMLGTLSIPVVVGLMVRWVARRQAVTDAGIRKLSRSISDIRAEERTVLADEIVGVLTGSFQRSSNQLRQVQSGCDPAQPGRVLHSVAVEMRSALLRLRQLVTALQPEAEDRTTLREVWEEIEEVLTMHGHPVAGTVAEDRAEDAVPIPLLKLAHRVGGEVVNLAEPGGTIEFRAGSAAADHALDGLGLSFALPVESVPDEVRLCMMRAELADPGTRMSWENDACRLRVDISGATVAMPQRALRPTWVDIGLPRWSGMGVLLAALLLLASSGQAALAGAPWVPSALWAGTLAGVGLMLWWPRIGCMSVMLSVAVGMLLSAPSSTLQPLHTQVVVAAFVAALLGLRWLAAVLVGWIVGTVLWYGHTGDLSWMGTILALPLLGAVVGYATAFFWHTRRSQRQRLAELKQEQAAARSDERRHLASELHDVVAYQLSLMSMQASASVSSTVDNSRAHRETVKSLIALNQGAQADLTTLVALLRQDYPAEAEPAGQWNAPAATAEVVAHALRGSGRSVALTLIGDVNDCEATTARTLTRMLREGATNILRYAPAGAACTIRIEIAGHAVQFAITNPMPVDVIANPDSTGNGLRGLRERALLTDATFRAEQVGDQWRMEARLPRTACVARLQSDPAGSVTVNGSTRPA
ncbi:MAG: histidine kinase [Propioniciclava sp.]